MRRKDTISAQDASGGRGGGKLPNEPEVLDLEQLLGERIGQKVTYPLLRTERLVHVTTQTIARDYLLQKTKKYVLARED